ncbi:MAG: hypothetical protein K2N27_02185 [Ruminococcus sp.]|nr:hypothetical protein [Ruminococcus sp.]
MIEKKLKKSAEKIVMPDELKERILEKCDDSVMTETNAEEITFTVEPYRKRRISHIVSWAAALTVVIGGLGYSTHLITKEGFYPDSMSDILSNAPFGSLADSTMDIYTCRFWTTFHNDEISDEVKAQINEFFSNMEYIEKEGYYYPPENINPDRPYMAYTIALLDTTNDIDNSQDCLSVLEDDTLSYNHSGITTYYQIDSKAFDKLIRSILPVCAPFGNLAERDNYIVTIDMENEPRTPDESQKNLLAGLFNGIKKWELIEDYDISTMNVRHEITFNGDTYESIFICEDDVLVYNKPDGTKEVYRIDFNETDKDIRYYMRKPAPFGSDSITKYEYDAYINISGDDYPVDYDCTLSNALYNFFDAMDWKPIENYDDSTMDVRHRIFSNDIGSIYISADDKLIYNNPDGVEEVYNINFAEFDELMKSLYPYKYDKEIKCGLFEELNGCKLSASLFRCVSIDDGAGPLDEKDSAKILEVLNSICIEEIPEPENAVFKNIGLDSVSFTTSKEVDGKDTGYNICVNLIKKYVMFSKTENSETETRFFRTDETNIMILLRNLRNDSAVYPPFASLWKTGDCTCTSEFFNGILSYEQAIMVTTAFYGWDWSDVYDLELIHFDISGELKYRFSIINQPDICVYDDDTIIMGNRLYQNIDKNDNNYLLYILDSIFNDEINPDDYNTQHEYPDGISQDDKDMLDAYGSIN